VASVAAEGAGPVSAGRLAGRTRSPRARVDADDRYHRNPRSLSRGAGLKCTRLNPARLACWRRSLSGLRLGRLRAIERRGPRSPGVDQGQGNRKTIQPLDGGIIKELLVKAVKTRMSWPNVIVLDETHARAGPRTCLRSNPMYFREEARLLAERDGERKRCLSRDLLAAA